MVNTTQRWHKTKVRTSDITDKQSLSSQWWIQERRAAQIFLGHFERFHSSKTREATLPTCATDSKCSWLFCKAFARWRLFPIAVFFRKNTSPWLSSQSMTYNIKVRISSKVWYSQLIFSKQVYIFSMYAFVAFAFVVRLPLFIISNMPFVAYLLEEVLILHMCNFHSLYRASVLFYRVRVCFRASVLFTASVPFVACAHFAESVNLIACVLLIRKVFSLTIWTIIANLPSLEYVSSPACEPFTAYMLFTVFQPFFSKCAF